MSKNATFQLDLTGGAVVLQQMAMKQVQASARSIASRAQSISGVEMSVTSGVGMIKRGDRAIATVSANGKNAHETYKATTALMKSTDAGKV